MNDTIPDDPAPEAVLHRLRELRRGLLHLHKTLLDAERVSYEKAHGQVTSGELLQLVISHEQFAWLHSVSELIVSIDEMLGADEPAKTNEASSLLAQARALIKPSENGGEFARRYYAALQNDPDVVFKHREVMLILSSDI